MWNIFLLEIIIVFCRFVYLWSNIQVPIIVKLTHEAKKSMLEQHKTTCNFFNKQILIDQEGQYVVTLLILEPTMSSLKVRKLRKRLES